METTVASEARDISVPQEVSTDVAAASTALVVADAGVQFVTTVDEARERVRQLQEFIGELMVPGVDYGVIPGTPKPTLFKPGAEKLCEIYGLAPLFEVVNRVEDWDEGFFHYETKCRLVSQRTGGVVAEGLGSCNSRERRFRNQDLFTIVNTILKMSKKRCLGGTVPLLVRTGRGISRGEVEMLYQIFLDGNQELFLPGPDAEWRRVKGVVRYEDREVFRIELRDGSYIRATAEHRFPTDLGLLPVADLSAGMSLQRATINVGPGDGAEDEFGWLAGLFVAEGHIDGDAVELTLHRDELGLANRVETAARRLGCTVSISGRANTNTLDVDVHGPAFRGLMQQFVEGNTSYQKHLTRHSWRQGRGFLEQLLRGYLAGDGCWVKTRGRRGFWMIGFTGRNYELAYDLRAICATLGYRLNLKRSSSTAAGATYPTFTGWIKLPADTYNLKDLNQVVAIEREPKGGVVYDIEVDGDHLFCLANGIVTHNSHVDATLSATRSSGIFTQDLEDLGGTFPPRRRDDPAGRRRFAPPAAPATVRKVLTRQDLADGWTRLTERGRQIGLVVEPLDPGWSDPEILRRGQLWKETIAAVEEATR